MTMRTDLIDRHSWYGNVTRDNVEAVAQRIFNMLNGSLYTFASCNDGFNPESSIGFDVRPDEYFQPSVSGFPIIVSNEQVDWGWYCNVTVCDSYGVWGFGDDAYISFEGNRKITIIHKAPAGHNLVWKIVKQDQDAPIKF